MRKRLKRLQWYSAITASILSFVVYLIIAYAFTDIDLFEMLCVFICFVLPLVFSIPFYITED